MTKLQLNADFRTTSPPEIGWQSLVGRIAPESGFLNSAWFDAWGRHLLPYDSWRGPLRYLTASGSDGQLQAVVALATQRQYGVAVASLGGLYWPFRSPLIARAHVEETCEALAMAFTRERRLAALRYGPVPDTDEAIALLNAALASRGWRLHQSGLGTTYCVELPATWIELERQLGKSLRTNIEYYERKLGREGTLEIRRFRGSADPGWSTAIVDLASVERKSWQFREGGRLRFHGERNAAFWSSLLVNGQFGEVATAWVMYFNGEPVSFCFCLDCGAMRYILANNYALSMHRYSTGSVLYKHVFRDAIEACGIRRINIGLGDSGYKSRWGARPAFELVDWIAFRPGLLGGALDLVWRLRTTLGRRRRARSDMKEVADADRMAEHASRGSRTSAGADA